jgi:hypothetical protein
MRVICVLVAALALGAPVAAQEPAAGARTSMSATDDSANLPVSLDRIREGLQKRKRPIRDALDVQPDFVVQIEEQAHIDEIMSRRLKFEKSFVPAGGLYAYEEQRRLFNPIDRPLQQPYAAYSAGEFFTVALENLIGRYLGGKMKDAVKSASDGHDAAAARREVDQSIEDYCAARSDRYQMELCNGPALR